MKPSFLWLLLVFDLVLRVAGNAEGLLLFDYLLYKQSFLFDLSYAV